VTIYLFTIKTRQYSQHNCSISESVPSGAEYGGKSLMQILKHLAMEIRFANLKIFYYGLTPLTVNFRYILHWRATSFFFYRRRYFLHTLALEFYVFQMDEIVLKVYESLHIMCLWFLSSIMLTTKAA
jgi:hypothetical protein